MAETTDVAIIGGGAAGCAVAYYLAQSGVRSTIIERDGLGNQASGYSAGGLNPLTGIGIPGPLGAFGWECFQLHIRLYDSLKEQSGIDYQHRTVAKLDLALLESEVSGLKASSALFEGVEGFDAHWLEQEEIAKLEPRISPDVLGGLYDYGNNAVDSHNLTEAFAAAAEKMGSTVRAGNVKSLEGSGGKIDRVILADGEISCGQVVLAMGPWSRRAEAWLGVYIPVDPLKGEIIRLENNGEPFKHDIAGGGGTIYPKLDGLNWCGTTEDWKGFDREPSEQVAREIRQRVVRLVPDLADAKLSKHTACLRPVTPDWLPVLGRAPGWDNVYLATGAGKKGILLATGIGKSVADLMTAGETTLSIQGCAPERFATQLD
ncbi:MAG: FAD-dependent oxidoreductase [Chloroflexi bacterium]|nr:FAD-dependent oxidoreductase [Chloroflexota bacterium]